MIRTLAAAMLAAAPVWAGGAPAPFPFALGGHYALTDQDGHTRTEADPDGRAQLLFFGYANCEEICSAALPSMADAVDLLARDGRLVTPVMITVDPERDGPAALARSLRQHHDRFVGLTGSPEALAVAYRAFQVETKELFRDPAGNPVFAHGSFLYLLDGGGRLLTVIPPVLSPAEVARMAEGYLPAGPATN